MSQTVLLSGAAGFAGRYMCQHLRSVAEELKIIGIDTQQCIESYCNTAYVADIADAEKMRVVMEQVKPQYIIHLAGTFGAGDVQSIYRINVLSMTALLEAMRQVVPSAIFISTGSAAEYGRIKTDSLPVTEETSCNPVMPYGLSKYLATQIATYYHRVHNLCTMTVRPFQLIGKGVTDRLAPGAFARRLLNAKQAGLSEIQVGNLDSCRDFLDVRDAVKAMWLLCQNPMPGEIFNLCSGKPVKISELLSLMQQALGTDIRPVTDQCYLRGKSDVDVVYGSYDKIERYCNWRPQITLEESVRNLFFG
jgi:GDP-4-dehydro-6-deoxy-D-mannose reductase